MQPELLFGLDINRNGMIDSHEAGRSSTLQGQGMGTSTSSVASEELAARGWSSFLTLFSQEKNVNAAGAPRVYINGENMEELFNQVQEILDDKWATFIVAYRQNGPFTGEDEATEARSGQLDLTLPAQATFVTVLDLVDATVRVTFDGEDEPTIMRSPITTENMAFVMPLLMDNLSTNPTPTIPGRININQAPRFMLLGIPGMEESIVDEIISRRDIVSDDDDPNRKHETWLLVEGIVPDLDTMKALLPYVCIGGDVHRAQVVGYFEGGEVSSRAEVIFDATGQDIRILLWRDISHLGRGFALETLGTELLPDL